MPGGVSGHGNKRRCSWPCHPPSMVSYGRRDRGRAKMPSCEFGHIWELGVAITVAKHQFLRGRTSHETPRGQRTSAHDALVFPASRYLDASWALSRLMRAAGASS